MRDHGLASGTPCSGMDADVEGQGLLAEQLPPRRASRPLAAWRPLLAVTLAPALIALCVVLGGQREVARPPRGAGSGWPAGVEELVALSGSAPANANDLWGIHDLLLMGYRAPFMKPGSAGLQEVQASAVELAGLLPQVHPHAPCRQRIHEAVAAAAGEARVVQAAQAAWDCLPAQFTPASFDIAFTAEGLDSNPGLAGDARNPKVLNPAVLGACAGTLWHRTCSYWVSLHAMAYRADALQLGPTFLHHALTVLAGGATMCGGCTLHLRVLHKPVLSASVISDLGELD